MKKLITVLALASLAIGLHAANDQLTVNCGDSVWISATPATGYHFVSWEDGNTDNPRKVVVTSDMSYQAQFAISKFHVVLTADNGTVIGEGEYDYGQTITISVTPDDCYHFTSWSDGNTQAERTITVTEDITLNAVCEIDTYTVSVSSNAQNMGTVSVVIVQ